MQIRTRAVNLTFDLFIELGASNDQADFPIIYTNAITQQAGVTMELEQILQPLFDAILTTVPGPKVDLDAPLQLLVTNLGYDEYRGVTAVGRIHSGAIKSGQTVARMQKNGSVFLTNGRRYLYVLSGFGQSGSRICRGG